MNAHVKPTTAQPCLPPPVGIPRRIGQQVYLDRVMDECHPLAHLMRLREEAAAQIERLIAFLDDTDGDTDLEPDLAGYSDGMDSREGDAAELYDDDNDSGIADLDGLMEQHPKFFAHCDQRVDA